MDTPEIETLRTLWYGRLLLIALFFLLAWGFHRLSSRLAQRIMRLNRFANQETPIRHERMVTLRALLSSGLTFIGFTIAILLSLSLFVDADTLLWMIGLFSAAFGLGARPLISDFLTGIGFIFEDTFDVGEKVEFLSLVNLEGVVETVNLRTTQIRAPTGELVTIPNGEIRLVRNYSRGRFSVANITLKIAAKDIQEAIAILEPLGQEAMTLLPNLLEPWLILSETGEMGQQTDLTLAAKARFGKAAEMRPRLLSLVQERMEKEGIVLKD